MKEILQIRNSVLLYQDSSYYFNIRCLCVVKIHFKQLKYRMYKRFLCKVTQIKKLNLEFNFMGHLQP